MFKRNKFYRLLWILVATVSAQVTANCFGEGIRNLEVAAHAGKLTVAPSINHLAAAIDRSCSTATAIKPLPETLGKFAVNNTIHFPACATWLDVSSTIKHFAGAVDSAKLTKLAPDKVELVAQDDHGRWIIRAAPHPYDFTKRPGIKPAPSLAPTDKYIVQAELQQFDSRKNKFITVRHGHMEVQHNLGFEDFAQDMANTFGLPKTKIQPHVPSGADAALAEIKKGALVGQRPMIVGNGGVVPEVDAVEIIPISTSTGTVEAVAEEIATAVEQAVVAEIGNAVGENLPTTPMPAQQKPSAILIPTAPSNAVTVIPKGKISFVETNLPVPQTVEEKHVFIAKEFELGIQHMTNIDDSFSYTSTIALSANEAEAVALKILEIILDNGAGFSLKQANKHRVEIVQVVHEPELVKTTTLRYRYPQIKGSGAQKGIEAGNLEYEIEKIDISGSGSIEPVSTTANLHLCIIT